MNTKTIGLVAIIIGALLLIYSGFNYVTTEKVVDLGPIKIDKEKNHSVQWPPVLGVVVLVAGVALTLSKSKSLA